MLQLKDFTSSTGRRYQLQTLPATTGLETFTKLMELVGAPMGNAAGGMTKTADGETDVKAESLGLAVGALTSRLAEPGTIALVKILLADLQHEQDKAKAPGAFVPVNFDLYFAANYGELLELIAFSVEINFASFLAGSAVVQRAVEAVRALIPARSTGESGASSSTGS